MLSSAVLAEDIETVKQITEKLYIKSVNQVSLVVPMMDARFPAVNMMTVSLHHSKPKILEFLIDHDMIDIATSCRRPLDNENAIQSSSAIGRSRSTKKVETRPV